MYYIGLITHGKNYGKKPSLEKTGLGDRILRWLIVLTLSRLKNESITIPIVESKFVFEHTNWDVVSLNKFFIFPELCSIKPQNNEALKNGDLISSKLYLEEKEEYGALRKPWLSIPEDLRHNLDEKEFIDSMSYEYIKPKPNVLPIFIDFSCRFIALHIRQSDCSFECQDIIDEIIPVLQTCRLPIAVVTDGENSLKDDVIKKLKSNKLDCLESKPINKLSWKEKMWIDYSIIWNSTFIISLVYRKFSAFPYCISLQKNIPIVFLPECCFDLKNSLTLEEFQMFV